MRGSDILRFGFTPLYTRFVDVWHAVEVLREILDTTAWDAEHFRKRRKVT
jgi:kynureninase